MGWYVRVAGNHSPLTYSVCLVHHAIGGETRGKRVTYILIFGLSMKSTSCDCCRMRETFGPLAACPSLAVRAFRGAKTLGLRAWVRNRSQMHAHNRTRTSYHGTEGWGVGYCATADDNRTIPSGGAVFPWALRLLLGFRYVDGPLCLSRRRNRQRHNYPVRPVKKNTNIAATGLGGRIARDGRMTQSYDFSSSTTSDGSLHPANHTLA